MTLDISNSRRSLCNMSRVWKPVVFILLVLGGIVLVLKFRRSAPTASPSLAAGISRIVSEPALAPVELTSFYDHNTSFDAPGCWQAVPRGLQTFANVPFRIAGLIQLWGEGPAGIGRQYRESVEGIPAVIRILAVAGLDEHGSWQPN